MLLLVNILTLRAVNTLPTSMPPETYSENFATPFHLSCEETHACTNCVSETESSYKTCGENFYGVIDNNFIDLVGDVDSESDCRDFCKSMDTCNYYTYFTEDDLHSKACVLLSSLMEPFQNCDTCLTGAVDCKGFGDCSLQYNGESHRSELQ